MAGEMRWHIASVLPASASRIQRAAGQGDGIAAVLGEYQLPLD